MYRLIDPRTKKTFYVGKGQGNRVFKHMEDELKFASGAMDIDADVEVNGAKEIEDEQTAKMTQIREIRAAGMEVIHIIHRHGMDKDTAFQVEAALIDAYPGLSNAQGGHGSAVYGPMSAKQIKEKYECPKIEVKDITDKCLIIKVNQQTVSDKGTIYEAVRSAWRLSLDRAKKAEYVLAAIDGVIREVYHDACWTPIDGRIEFVKGETLVSEEIALRYCNHRLPDEYTKKGSANPCQYVNC